MTVAYAIDQNPTRSWWRWDRNMLKFSDCETSGASGVVRYPFGNYESWTSAIGSPGKRPVLEYEDEFSEYEMYDAPNWDGYGARPITLQTVDAARQFNRLLPRHVPPADIAPGADGTIGFEWRVGPPSAREFTLVDIGPGDQIMARQVREDGSLRKFPPTRPEEGARALIRQLFPL